MPQPQQSDELTAADIRKLLNEKFPATNTREKVYVSIILALLDNQEVVEAQVKGIAELIGRLLTVLEINPKTLMEMSVPQTKVEGEGASSAGGAGVGGAGGSGASGGGVATSPVVDKTPFPAGVPTSAPPGTAQRVVVQPTAEAAETEIPQPNVQSGPAVNVRPNISPNGAPKVTS
jgi:hypothetical protein